jgi:hypothetical protein
VPTTAFGGGGLEVVMALDTVDLTSGGTRFRLLGKPASPVQVAPAMHLHSGQPPFLLLRGQSYTPRFSTAVSGKRDCPGSYSLLPHVCLTSAVVLVHDAPVKGVASHYCPL